MSSEIFDVVASCSKCADEFFASIYGTVCAPHLSPIRSESHAVKLRVLVALRCAVTRPRYVFCDLPAAIPLEMIRLVVFLPRWIILVPESACWKPFEIAIE